MKREECDVGSGGMAYDQRDEGEGNVHQRDSKTDAHEQEYCEESWDGLGTLSLFMYLRAVFLSIPRCFAIAVTLIPFSFISLIIIHTS